MDEDVLIGYQLERYHHIQNQAAKILGLILTSLSTLIALIGAVLLEIIEIPSPLTSLLTNIVAEDHVSAALGLNSVLMLLISFSMFFLTFVIYALIVSDSSISTDASSFDEFGTSSTSAQVTITSNKIGINKLENLWRKSSVHMTISVTSLIFSFILIGYSTISDQLPSIVVHVFIVLIPAIGGMMLYATEDPKQRVLGLILFPRAIAVYVIAIFSYTIAWLVSLITVLSSI